MPFLQLGFSSFCTSGGMGQDYNFLIKSLDLSSLGFPERSLLGDSVLCCPPRD